MEFNEKQLEAINLRNKNLLVSAGAGSGKTTVLVERILSLLKENDDNDLTLDRMLVMTFSRKAAIDLKKKIKNSLIDNIANSLYGSKEYNKFTSSLGILQNANIQTIDSFCKNLIEQNYTNLSDFDPSFRIADEKELNILYDDVLKNLLEEIYLEEEYKSFLSHYYIKNDNVLSELFSFGLNAIYNEPYPLEKLDYFIDNNDLIEENLFNIYKSGIEFYNDKIDKITNLYKNAYEAGKNIVEYFNNKNDKKNKISETEKSIREWVEFSERELTDIFDKIILSKDIIDKLKMTLELVNEKNILYTGRIKNADMAEYIDILKEYKNEAKEFFTNKEINVFLINCELKENLIKDKDLLIYLKLLKEYYIRIEDEKKVKKILAIQDLSKLALKILYDDDKDENGKRKILQIGQRIIEKYKQIFVDEYQDTNYLQEELIRAISNNYKNKNVFLVGDVKQSIYGFRGTKSELFVDKYKQYIKYENENKVINLNTNYRSAKEIINYVNALFSFLMTNDTLGLNYKNEGMLIKEVSDTSEKGEVVVDFILKNNEIDNTVNEAKNIIKHINELINSGYKYKDIVILTRTVSNKAEVFLDEFMKAGIPLYAEMKKGFYQRFEIKLVIDILNVIDNPIQDIPLASVLTSKVFNITNEELAYIKILYNNSVNFGKNDIFSLYDAVKYFSNVSIDNLENLKKYNIDIKILKNKINIFFEKHNIVSFKSRFTKISDIIEYIYEDMNVYNIISTMKDGNIRKANLDILYNNAVNFEKSSYVGLFNFLRYIERIKENELDEGTAKLITENSDIVRLMTIHASKGLEFKVVFLANINYKKQLKDDLFYYNDEYGFALDYYDENNLKYKTYKQIIISNKNHLLNQKDELRLFYVALTRAKTKLYIQGIVEKNKQESLEENISLYENNNSNNDLNKEITMDEFLACKSFMDFIFLSMPYVNSSLYKINIISENEDEIEKITSEEKKDINIDTIDEIVQNEMSNRIKNNKRLQDVFKIYTDDNIKNNLEFKYKNIELTTKKPKLSVSEIKNGVDESVKIIDTSFFDDINVDDDEELKNETKDYTLGGAKLGNAYHRFMQFFDFENVTNNEQYNIFINRDNIDKNKIELFLNTELGKNMKKAYKDNRLYREKRFMKLFKESYLSKLSNNAVKESDKNIDPLIIVQGIIDCFYIEKNDQGEDEIVLIDYKTDKILSKSIDKEDLKKQLKENYAIQLELYKEALANMLNMNVKKKIIYSFAINESIEV